MGNAAREGPGETRPRTEQAAEDRRRLELRSLAAPGAAAGSDDARSTGGASTHPREPLPAHAEGLPSLPPSYHAALDEGLAACGLTLDPPVRQAIDDHVRLLLAWNASINLTAVREPEPIARQHILDSLAAVPLLHELGATSLLDLGSGGGYPGLPLALATPAMALLVESIGKKARFLETVVTDLAAESSIGVANARAETLAADPNHREQWPIVTARAVAPLAELVELAWPLLTVGGHLVAWKRLPVDLEVEAGLRAITGLEGRVPADPRFEIRAMPGEIPGLGDHVLIVAAKRRSTPAPYPRAPAGRKRQPW